MFRYLYLVAVAALVALGVGVALPPQAAQALGSSLDNPGNFPIMAALGLIGEGAGTAAATTAGVGLTDAGVVVGSQIASNALATSVGNGIVGTTLMGGLAGAVGGGALLFSNGAVGNSVKTNPLASPDTSCHWTTGTTTAPTSAAVVAAMQSTVNCGAQVSGGAGGGNVLALNYYLSSQPTGAATAQMEAGLPPVAAGPVVAGGTTGVSFGVQLVQYRTTSSLQNSAQFGTAPVVYGLCRPSGGGAVVTCGSQNAFAIPARSIPDGTGPVRFTSTLVTFTAPTGYKLVALGAVDRDHNTGVYEYGPYFSYETPVQGATWTGTVRSTATCKAYTADGSGALYTVVKAALYSVVGGASIPLPDVMCTKGDTAFQVLYEYQPTGTTSWTQLAAPLTITPSEQTVPQTYPKCFGPDAVPCTLTLRKVSGTTDESCGDGAKLCPDWAKDPNYATNYKCYYGTYSVDISLCSALRSPSSGLQPNTKPGGALYAVIDGPVDPPTQVTTVNNVITNTTIQYPPPVTTTTIDTSTDANGDCFPSGWGVLNPVSWVIQPVECAARWLFIPSQVSINDESVQAQSILANSGLGSLSTVAGSLQSAFNISASGCVGPPLHFEAFGVNSTYYPFSACDEPMRGVASAISGMLAFSIVALTILSGTRYLAATFGFVGLAGSNSASSGPKFE